mgnify:CR=1 FL=1
MSEENLNQSGLQFTTNKEGLKEATWEGDFFQRSDVETKDKGMDNDWTKQVPVLSSISTLADGIVPAVGEYVETPETKAYCENPDSVATPDALANVTIPA